MVLPALGIRRGRGRLQRILQGLSPPLPFRGGDRLPSELLDGVERRRLSGTDTRRRGRIRRDSQAEHRCPGLRRVALLAPGGRRDRESILTLPVTSTPP